MRAQGKLNPRLGWLEGDEETGKPRGPRMPFVVGVGGGLSGGVDTCLDIALLAALKTAQVAGASVLFLGLQFLDGLYADAHGGRHATAEQLKLWRALADADGIILAGSSRDGALSPVLQETLMDAALRVGEDRKPFDDRAVACIVAAPNQRVADWGLTSLRTTVHELGGWPTPTGVAIDLSLRPFNATGTCSKPKIQEDIVRSAQQVVAFAAAQRAGSASRKTLLRDEPLDLQLLKLAVFHTAVI